MILTFFCQECDSSYRRVRRTSQPEVQCSCTFQGSVLTGIQIFPFCSVFRIPSPSLREPMKCHATEHGTVPFHTLVSYTRGLSFASHSASSEPSSFVFPSKSCSFNSSKASTTCFRISVNQLQLPPSNDTFANWETFSVQYPRRKELQFRHEE